MADSCCTSAGAPDDKRRSRYPMIPVEDAVIKVLQNAQPLPIEEVHLNHAYGRIVALDVTAKDPFPAFRASIMDGYAVQANREPGIYPVQQRIHAGDSAKKFEALQYGNAVYITTGAMVPEGADAVVKIEDTTAVKTDSDKMESSVEIAVKVPLGANIRQVGCDIHAGEVILRKGQTIGAAEVGILATVGVMAVSCFRRPVIGILSTGSELVDPSATPIDSQIRDSNKVTLLAAFKQEGYDCIDLGICNDSADDLETAMTLAMGSCDVVVTSGGVSMGDADLVKPMLEKLGTVHFGRINMKPGKPATFATLKKPLGGNVLFFGLPGNPVSCLVTKCLFADPALKRLQGFSAAQCMPPQLPVMLLESLKLDPERPEYHRAIVALDGSGRMTAKSTGNQQSSRLLSMSSANALLCLPQGSGSILSGTIVTAILTGQIGAPDPSACYHKAAACLDNKSSLEVGQKESPVTSTEASKKTTMNVGLLTISDRASAGIYGDESGPEMWRMLETLSTASQWPLSPVKFVTQIVPDDKEAIQGIITKWCDTLNVDLILTSGGTGFGERDGTPEAVRPMLHREAPAVAQALINEGLKHTPLAALSRPVVGTRFNTLICTLPGSVKAVKENMVALGPLIPRIMELITEGKCMGKH